MIGLLLAFLMQGKRILPMNALIPQPHFDQLSASLLPRWEKGSQISRSKSLSHPGERRCPEFAEGDLGRGFTEYAFALVLNGLEFRALAVSGIAA